MAFSGMLRRVTLVRTDVSEELSASFIRVTRIGEPGTMLAVTSNRRKLRRKNSTGRFQTTGGSAGISASYIRVTRIGELGTKMPFFIVTALKTSNITEIFLCD
jgi:hypothetical protein